MVGGYMKGINQHFNTKELKSINGRGNCTVFVTPLAGLDKNGDAIFGNTIEINSTLPNEASCQEVRDASLNEALDQAVNGLKNLGMADDKASIAREMLGPQMGRHEFTE